jgi:hypothetical protein
MAVPYCHVLSLVRYHRIGETWARHSRAKCSADNSDPPPPHVSTDLQCCSGLVLAAPVITLSSYSDSVQLTRMQWMQGDGVHDIKGWREGMGEQRDARLLGDCRGLVCSMQGCVTAAPQLDWRRRGRALFWSVL